MTVRSFEFKGNRYLVSCIESTPSHPTWFTFIDEAEVRDRDWGVGPGDCVFDVGAAFGSYTLTALAAGAAHAFAWAPQGMPGECTEADMLARSLHENGWRNRCGIFTEGVYDKTGWLDAVTQEFTIDAPVPPRPDVLRVRTLDEWFVEEFQPNHWKEQYARYWMKLDVEGAEVEVFKGAKMMIETLKPRILVELHRFKRPNVDAEVTEVLAAYGYRQVSCVPYHSVAHAVYAIEP